MINISNPTILVFAAGGIGDILQTTPMLRGIKSKYPDSKVVVLVLGESQKYLLRNNAYCNKVINIFEYKGNPILWLLKIVIQLRNEKIDICFFNHAVQRPIFYLIPFFAGIENRIGHDKTKYAHNKGYKLSSLFMNHRFPYIVAGKHKIKMNLELLKILDIDYEDNHYDRPDADFEKQNNLQKIVGIHPGSDSSGKIRRWVPEYFNELANRIEQELGYIVKFYIGPDDKDIEEKLESKFIIVKEKSLEYIIKDISKNDFFISNDSGLSHIAAAFNIPTLVIYGPTLSQDITLPTKYIAAEVSDLKCRPCWHLRQPCKIGHICMKDLRSDTIFTKFKQLIQ